MKLFASLAATLFIGLAIPAQAQEVHDSVDQMPEMIGGMNTLADQIVYPASARDEGIEGRVLIEFVVDEEGNVVDPHVLEGTHPDLDEAALAAVEDLRFEPGIHEGSPAKVRMVLPITFRLPPELEEPEHDAGDVDDMPEIVGGMASLVDNIRYPQEAEAEGIEGRVIVTFVVDEDGDVLNAEVHDSVHPLLDAAAIAAVEATTFTPGTKGGQPVAVQMAVPITFSLPG